MLEKSFEILNFDSNGTHAKFTVLSVLGGNNLQQENQKYCKKAKFWEKINP